MPLLKRLQEWSKSSPQSPFIIDGDRVLTYGGAYEAACRAASALLEKGVQPGDRVLLALPNSPEFVVVLYGILQAGASAVLVNPRLTPHEIQNIIELTRPRVCVGHVLSVAMTEPQQLLTASFPLLPRRENPTGIGLMLLTSGTTGKPKAVMLRQEAIAANASQMAKRKQLTPTDRFLCSIPLFHSNGQVAVLQSMLMAGASLVLMERFSPEGLIEYVQKYQVTAISGVPTLYQQLLHFHEKHQVDLSSLRLCICGSAPLPVSLFEEVERRFGALILEGYGLTEASAGATGNPIEGRRVGTVGLPLEGTEIKIVDELEKSLPAGSVGEVFIRGPQLMDGYFEDAEATRKAMTADGFLRTGDLGSLDDDGYLKIHSRKKELIIRGGFNIYPAEVEGVLREVEGVLEVAVVGLPDATYGENVHAALVSQAAPEELRKRLVSGVTEKLARYKRPTSFSLHTDFPRTGSSKVQRAKLQEEILSALTIRFSL